MHNLLKSYLKRLTDLTARNRSLVMLRLPRQQFIDLYDFQFEIKGGAFGIIESLIAQKSIRLTSYTDTHNEAVNLLSRRLKNLQRHDHFIREERGSADMYVGWPMVRGKLSNGAFVRCPLLFFPVRLQQSDNTWVLQQRQSGIVMNKSFLLAYSFYNEIKLKDDFLDRNFEDFDTDSTVFRTALYQLFKESPLEINFNQENFEDTLKPFANYKKEEFEENNPVGQLKLYPEAVLGIYPQAGSYLVPDYLNLIENKHIKDLEDFFASKTLAEGEIKKIDEEKLFTPFKLDAHQENAINVIKNGQSLVVQGPPGTGKSQLICNLVADHIAIGKKVLVVCQKRAALDVVYQRMEEKELTGFLGLVHDFRNDRKSIYDKIARQINRIDEYKLKNNSLDAIQLERSFLHNSRRIDQITEELEEFKFALFDESECGLSAKELYLTSDPEKPSVNLKQEYKFFKFDDLYPFAQKLNNYAGYAKDFDHPQYIWADRKPFQNYGASDRIKIQEALEEIPAYQAEVNSKMEALLGQPLDLDVCESIFKKRDQLVEMLGILKSGSSYQNFRHLMQFPDDETSNLWLSNIERVLMECYKGAGPEVSLPANQLGEFQEVLERNMNARKSLFRLLHWRLFSKDKFFIKRVLVANGLKRNKEGFGVMVEKVDNRLNLEHNLTKIKQKPWIKEVPQSYEKVHFQNWFYWMKQVVKAKLIFNNTRNLKDLINVQVLSYKEFRKKLDELFVVITEIHDRFDRWHTYLTHQQILRILQDPGLSQRLARQLKKDFDSLCEFDAIKENLGPHEHLTIGKLVAEDNENMLGLFQNSLRLAWIEHIELKYPVLRSVSSRKFQALEAELQNCVSEKLKISNDMLLLRARERTYEGVEYNRLNNMVTYRDLLHQTTKKRRIWPIRKVINEYYEELFNLIPCWLGSPESVSAIFPMREMFDLVIFDEASQCFVERGIPAMYRGRQVLIAGDDKQLRPNDLYQVRYEEEPEESEMALEVDSLLELANHHLMDVQLKGHYRSKSLELIDFSNKHFYGANLRLLPDHEVVNRHEPAITFEKVEGVWDNNTNYVEADQIINILLAMVNEGGNKTVGVVTFNAPQQQLILDLIDERFVENGIVLPESWFVKNIENVQGDEKDVIIFSIGYAPDQNGKMNMQFGSLNSANGENRLNVAITRAREKIIIVSSILPHELKVQNTKNIGPKLLQEYLQYAKDVSEDKFEPTAPPASAHTKSWYLKDTLEKYAERSLNGYDFSEELPFADITVKQDKYYLGLITTDDDLYYQGLSIKDRHVYTPFVLTKKNWKFKSVFSRQYWSDRETVREELGRFLTLNGVNTSE